MAVESGWVDFCYVLVSLEREDPEVKFYIVDENGNITDEEFEVTSATSWFRSFLFVVGTGVTLDARWSEKDGVMHGTTADDWVSDELTQKELTPYFGPTNDELEELRRKEML